LIGTYALSSGYYDQYYTKAQNVRNLIRHDFTEAFKHVDVILAPTTSSTAFKIGELIDDPVSMYQQDLYTIPVNLAEFPSISFPVGLADGLPFGMQLIGPKWSESKLLNLTHQLQSVTQWHQALPKSLVQTRET
jgi:aspartyl-tRNA(Asn)/glutamyl-tRNA(Gln) amidotransferase subunit A